MPKRPSPPPGSSYSQEYISQRQVAPPPISDQMVRGVSQYRKDRLEEEVNQGHFREGSGLARYGNMPTGAGTVLSSSSGVKKNAQVLSSGFGAGMSGLGAGGGTAKQIPEIYSPLWLTSNLNLPRDRATINAWCRAFFALNPYVHNAINLHSTYPISKLNIKCANKEVEDFFNNMIEEIGLVNICVQIAMEYWLLGEAFPYGELDQNKGKWSHFILQNPDYMIVKRTVIADEPAMMLRPDLNLHRIINSNKPSDVEQRKKLHPYIIDAVRSGENIPLNNFNVSHIARKISPYEIRGTGLPVCVFRQLMLFDKMRESQFAQADNMINPLTLVKIGSEGLDGQHPTHGDLEAWREAFECYDEETEVLTDVGFKKFDEVIEYQEVMDGTYNQPYISQIRPVNGVKIACFNPNNEQLEYHQPINASLYNYDGDMYHFSNDKMDIKVTPNHKMWVQEREYEYSGEGKAWNRKATWGQWKKVEAQNIKLTDYNRFRSQINWIGQEQKSVNVCGKEVPIDIYLEFLGYLLSEGCLYTNYKSQYTISISQTLDKYKDDMHKCLNNLCKALAKTYSHRIEKRSQKSQYKDIWSGTICSKEIYEHFKAEIGDASGKTKAIDKRIPLWIKQLSPKLLSILLEALIKGDGSIHNRKDKDKNGFSYYTISKQLADDVYELVYKCGYVPTMFERSTPNGDRLLYTVMWSNSGKGEFPLFWKTSRNSQTKQKKDNLHIEHYSGKVWCFQVPTGLFITRRRGRITIQGNSVQFDKDAKIFTHPGVQVERVGYGQGIYDVNPTLQQLIKEFYVGLMVPPVVLDGGGDITYQNGGVSMDVLRQRYMQFRNMMALWLKRKVFAPISEIQQFWEYKKGGAGRSSEKQLIIPDVDWNHMSLFDAGDYTANLITLTTAAGEGALPRASLHTLYRSLGLEWEDEQRKLRREAIQTAIAKREQAVLDKLALSELQALTDEDEIVETPEQAEQAVPGETGGAGAPMPDLGSLPPMPSTPAAPSALSTPPTSPPPVAPTK